MSKLDKMIPDEETFTFFVRARAAVLSHKYHFDGYEVNTRTRKTKDEPKYFKPLVSSKTRKFIRRNIDDAHFDLTYIFGNPASAKLKYTEGYSEPELVLYRYIDKYDSYIYVRISRLERRYPDGSVHNYYVVNMHELFGKPWKLNLE